MSDPAVAKHRLLTAIASESRVWILGFDIYPVR